MPKLNVKNPDPMKSLKIKEEGWSSKAKGRAYTLTVAEAKALPDVVSGTFAVNDVPATILFDSGASRSFVSITFCPLLDRSVKELVQPFTVETAVGVPVKIGESIDDCYVNLE